MTGVEFRVIGRNRIQMDSALNSAQDTAIVSIRSIRNKWSGRKDLNLRPPGPEPGALARLRYAPTQHDASEHTAFVRNTRIAQPMGPYQELSGKRSPGNKPRLIAQMATMSRMAICAMKQIHSPAGSDPCLT